MSAPIYSVPAHGSGSGPSGFVPADNFNNINNINSATYSGTFEDLFKNLSPSAAHNAINQQRTDLSFPPVESRWNGTPGKSAISASSRGRADDTISALCQALLKKAMEQKEADEARHKRVESLREEVRKVNARLSTHVMMIRQQREASRNQPKPVHNPLPGVRSRAYKNTSYGLGVNSSVPDSFDDDLESYKL